MTRSLTEVAPTFFSVQRNGEQIVEAARQFKDLRYDPRGVQAWKDEKGVWRGRTHCWGLLTLTAIEAGLLPPETCPNLLPWRENVIQNKPEFSEAASERVVKSLLCQNARRVARGQDETLDGIQAGDLMLFRFGQSTRKFHIALVADPNKRTILHAIDKTVGRHSKRLDHVYEEPLGPLDFPFIRSLWRLNACCDLNGRPFKSPSKFSSEA